MRLNLRKFLPTLVLTLLIQDVYSLPPFYIEKIDSIPDLTQTAPKANFPAGGNQFCIPVAVSNSLFWLNSNGFPGLVDNTGHSLADQANLAKLLASKAYMDTDPNKGTKISGFMEGLVKYIVNRGYRIELLIYQGWNLNSEDPNLDQIKCGIIGSGCVWLNAGWYKYDASKNEYKKIGSHWVTLVGYGKDQNNNPDPNILIIHDPSSRAGNAFANEYVRLILITDGILTGNAWGLPRNASGFYKLTGGMHIKRTANCAILDGVIIFKLKTRTSKDKTPSKSQVPEPNKIIKE